MKVRSQQFPAAFLVLALWTCTTDARGGAILEMRDTLFDFGFVPQHSHVSHRFMLHSKGDQPVEISRVVPGCACTRVPLETNIIEPGDSTVLEITFNSHKYTNFTERTPRFYTNHAQTLPGAECEHTITYRANVVTRPDSTFPITIYPYKLDMSPAGQVKREKSKFTITNLSDAELSLTMIASPAEVADVELPSTIPAKGEVVGYVRLHPESLEKEFEKSFTFQLNDSAQSRFTVPIRRFLTSASAQRSLQESEAAINAEEALKGK